MQIRVSTALGRERWFVENKGETNLYRIKTHADNVTQRFTENNPTDPISMYITNDLPAFESMAYFH